MKSAKSGKPVILQKFNELPRKLNWATTAMAASQVPKKSCSAQMRIDAFVQEERNVKMDSSVNVTATSLTTLVNKLISCEHCGNEWDGFAQCTCRMFDECDAENEENNLVCDEEIQTSEDEFPSEDRTYVPKDRYETVKKPKPLDIIYKVFKKYGIVNEQTYKYSLGRDKEVQDLTSQYAYNLQKLKHICVIGRVIGWTNFSH